MDRFPLPEEADYSYTQRFTMQHLGIDILAPLGTLVLAVEDGIATASREPKGGNVVYLDGVSGTRYFYGHLWQWTPNLVITDKPGVPVKAGDQLGYVGSSGNAKGRPSHVHFQMRIGSLLIDPFPELQAVDPHPERGQPGETVHRKERPPGPVDRAIDQALDKAKGAILPPVVLLLVLVWAANKALR